MILPYLFVSKDHYLYTLRLETAAPFLWLLSVLPSKDFITNEGISFPTCCNHHLLCLEDSDIAGSKYLDLLFN